MELKLISGKNPVIKVQQMKDGEIAEVVSWELGTEPGTLLQRVGQKIITLGKGVARTYPSIMDSSTRKCLVRVLRPGETIEIQ